LNPKIKDIVGDYSFRIGSKSIPSGAANPWSYRFKVVPS